MPAMPTFAVLGFRPHTYWTAVAAVAGPAEAPRVIERRRITFAQPEESFVYHRAADSDWREAPALIEAARVAQQAAAVREIGQLLMDLQKRDVAVRVAVTAASTAKLPERLDDVLSTHSRIHAAEGTFAREVIAQACGTLKLTVHRVVERELGALAADHLRISHDQLAARLRLMGAELGPPWSEDFKLCVQAAWLQLAPVAA
ncbi:hypothetical protein [Phenylobacterium sp.]|uniref:hypothetical protein n=1 Tax=Phenylobacterium sp. TaxID=1871053 RepID=UPI002F9307FF